MSKVLFLIGAGASIGSANKEIIDVLGPLSIPNFLSVALKMTENSDEELEFLEKRIHLNPTIFNVGASTAEEIKKMLENDPKIKIAKLYKKIDPFAKHEKEDNDFSSLKFYPPILKRMIMQVTGGYYSTFNTEYYKELAKIAQKYNSTIISLNWDCCQERSISDDDSDWEKYYSESVRKECKSEENQLFPRILKPHGSISWFFHDGRFNATLIGNMPKNKYQLYIAKPYYKTFDAPVDYVIIPPYEEKDIPELDEENIINKLDQYAIRKLRLLKNIRSEIRKAVDKAKTLVIIGYSFPKIDKHILELFKENHISKLLILEPDEKTRKRVLSLPIFKNVSSKNKIEFEKGFQEIKQVKKHLP